MKGGRLLSRRALGFFLFLLTMPCWGKILFSGLDLAEDDRLLFQARSSGGGAETQNALFCVQLPNRSVSLLSTFPEKMELVEGGKTLLVYNAFGSQRIPVSGGLPQGFPGFSAFAGISGGRVENTAASPDGRWLLYVEPTSHAKGNLILLDGLSGRKITVSAGVERPARYFPALWGDDSRGILYAKKGQLYFFTVGTQTTPPDERFRIIGEGAVNSVYWGSGGSFYYLRGSTVYRIRSGELFARTLYTGFLSVGETAGSIPFDFDPNFDRFWIAPDGQSMLLCKGGRNLFYYPLGIKEDTPTDFASLPYIIAPRSGAQLGVLWSDDGIATVLIGIPTGGNPENEVLAYRLNTAGIAGGIDRTFETLESPPSFRVMLSPDGRKAIFWGKSGLHLYDYRSWKLLTRIVSEPVYSCLWTKNDELIVGGEERIESVRLSGNTPSERKLLCLASVSRYGFEDNPSAAGPSGGEGSAAPFRRILAYSGDTWYITNGETPWTEYRLPSVRESSIVSSRYRVYLENSGGTFENIPMVRNITSVGTFFLFEPGRPPGRTIPAAANPSRISPLEEDYAFTYGSRGGREIALCFDLYDDASGLSTVLDTLNRYGIRATFFINGEFIRRHPQSARDLAGSGQETASMFFAPLDLSDSRYRIDKDFVTRGLARNEDEYFKATGRELSLLWHPPFYALSKEITAAAATAGYRTIGRDVDSRDWIRTSDAKRLGIDQLTAADMIDYIVNAAEGGSIIPIRLGILEGSRADYLFNSLEVLLDALLREGYEPVPVSTMLGRNR
ncbi:MAG: polysaccharide deacetylase family protein [Treponema sp.]|nr:polysaccharide deacetylase family protein [Treponema sp.]